MKGKQGKKNILAGMVLFCGLIVGSSKDTMAQSATNTKVQQASGRDSLVKIAYRTVDRKDMPGAVSILNPPQYLDKSYGLYPLEGAAAFVGGDNFWNMNGALVLIDGVPRSINDITANEIEQITFLKGANAI